jgi:hypothetical protein
MLNKPTRKEPVMSNQNAATVIYDDGTVTIAWRDFDTRSDAETWITRIRDRGCQRPRRWSHGELLSRIRWSDRQLWSQHPGRDGK